MSSLSLYISFPLRAVRVVLLLCILYIPVTSSDDMLHESSFYHE